MSENDNTTFKQNPLSHVDPKLFDEFVKSMFPEKKFASDEFYGKYVEAPVDVIPLPDIGAGASGADYSQLPSYLMDCV